MKSLQRTSIFIGLLLGIAIFSLYRFAAFTDTSVHHHANFALYIDGKQELFEDAGFYEEISACSEGDHLEPTQRAHMHKPDNNIVHVHDEAVTWGAFLENIGYSISDNHLQAKSQVYTNNSDKRVYVWINGSPAFGLSSREIASEDRVLISYGNPTSDELQIQYDSIATNAQEYNETEDPGSCSGSKNADTFGNRLKHILF